VFYSSIPIACAASDMVDFARYLIGMCLSLSFLAFNGWKVPALRESVDCVFFGNSLFALAESKSLAV